MFPRSDYCFVPSIWALVVSIVYCVAVQISISTVVLGWETCTGSGATCPNGNLCCSNNLCLSSADETTALNSTCCIDDMTTGCGIHYICSTTDTRMCNAINPTTDDVPEEVPRIKLCTVTPDMKHVYAIPMINEEANSSCNNNVNDHDGISSNKIPVALYLSTMGAIHEDNVVFENIQRVIILIHGSRRNVDDYLCCVTAAIPSMKNENYHKTNDRMVYDSNTILFIAPWFPTEDDGNINITATTSQTNATNQFDTLRWIGNSKNADPFTINRIFHTWRYGAGSINYPSISSFDIVDRIVKEYLYDSTKFPNLKNIIVTGHSAGGQYVQRWALLSNSIHDTNDIIPNSSQNDSRFINNRVHTNTLPTVRTVVANPKSYAYLDGRRFMESNRRHDIHMSNNNNNSDNKNSAKLDFRIPNPNEVILCPIYNSWEWGMDQSDQELVAPYVQKAIDGAGGIDSMIVRYAQRDVLYLSGEQDIEFNGDCNDHIQGPNRRARSERYYLSLQFMYNEITTNTNKTNLKAALHQRWVVPNVPHNHCLMYQSLQGQQALFGIIKATRINSIAEPLFHTAEYVANQLRRNSRE
jgi:hypothetical protein